MSSATLTLGELDLHLIGEGRHEELWRIMGSHLIKDDKGNVLGTIFRVWAPNARAVNLIGDFNYWDKATSPMIQIENSGIWELYIEKIGIGTRYKFAILGSTGAWVDHADPFARETEIPPASASVVNESTYKFKDDEWMNLRSKARPWEEPLSVYEVHLGSWKPGLSYRELAIELVTYVKKMGFTHVELLPICGHPYSPSWGYQVTSFFAPTPKYGNPDDLRYLIDSMHRAGIGVIMDWVPAHFPKDEWALSRFDGTHLYEHEDPRKGEHPDWGTLIFNYDRNEVRNFLIASALYWLKEFHIDGIRVDAVASMLYLDYSRENGDWIPNENGGRENFGAIKFLQELTATCYREVPDCMIIAEESTAWPGVTSPTYEGGLGFGFKWNLGWMHDTLEFLVEDPINRSHHHDSLTKPLLYAFSENYILPFSHDEVVHGKGSMISKLPGDRWQQLATLRALYGFMWAHPGKKLLFMGSEFAQSDEWNSEKSLDWHLVEYAEHQQIQRVIADLNNIYKSSAPLWKIDQNLSGFKLIDSDKDRNIVSFIRTSEIGEQLLCITNFSPIVHNEYPVPFIPGGWCEIFNTDSIQYGGSGVTNPNQNLNSVRVPPLATSWFLQGNIQ